MSSTSPQIKHFIMTAYEYQRRRTDRNQMQIQRQLQILSVETDLLIFEPSCMETLEFYICLEKLLTSADPKSTLAWKIITLFAHFSQSQNIRVALRDDILIVPVLSNFLLTTKFNSDKTHKLLQLIEAISYKIKIPHAEAWVITLIRYLADIVKEDSNDELFLTALSILANLCRFNPPALACLRGYAFSKPMVQHLIDMKCPSKKERLLAAEMMLYLHQDYSRQARNSAEQEVTIAVDCVLQAAIDGFLESDISCLQLAADVFAAFAATPSLVERLRERDYAMFLQNIMKYLTPENPEPAVEILLDLLFSIIDLDQPAVQPMFEDMFGRVMKWIQSERCCLPALRVLRTLIVLDKKFIDSPQVEEFIAALTVILDLDDAMHLSPQKLQHINSVLILLEELCNHDTTLRMKLAVNFQAPKFNSLLKLVMGSDCASKSNDTWTSQLPEVSINCTWRDLEFTSAPTGKRVSRAAIEDRMSQAVVLIMTVVKLLGSHNGDFLIEYDQMLSNPDTMKHLVRCERSQNPDLISKAVMVFSNGSIPSGSMGAVVKAIEESNSPRCLKQDMEFLLSSSSANRNIISFTPDWEARVDRMIERLSGTVERLELKDISLTAVMDMYEYKLAAMAHTEETFQNALAAADTRYRQTKLSLSQTQAQTDQLRKLLRVWEDRLCSVQQEKVELHENIKQIQKSSKQFRDKLINEKTATERMNQELRGDVKQMKAFLEAKDENIQRLQRQLQEAQAESKTLQRVIKEELEKQQKSQVHIQKLEDDIKKGGRDYEALQKEVQRLEKSQTELKKENSELELLIHSHEETIASKEGELEQVSKNFQELKRIQDLIHNMSSGKVPL